MFWYNIIAQSQWHNRFDISCYPVSILSRKISYILSLCVYYDLYGAGSQAESAGAQAESAGAQAESAGAQAESAGAQAESAGAQAESAGAQAESAGAQAESAGAQAESAGVLYAFLIQSVSLRDYSNIVK